MKISTTLFCSLITIITFFTADAHANGSMGSEMSHAVGGALMAGSITAVVDRYYPEYRDDRRMIGFGVSTVAIFAEQGVEYALHGNAGGQLMDATTHMIGSAIGAWVTDRFILSPVVTNYSAKGKYIGLQLQGSF
ncbi:MAG: hypothetical protein KJ990_01410 [Proteobacteria bacterium]|nr:hypothetical protein [Pseudomonadota bacterium]MBU1649426.1 hypothetical protein [Pseudomonadota bacterium]